MTTKKFLKWLHTPQKPYSPTFFRQCHPQIHQEVWWHPQIHHGVMMTPPPFLTRRMELFNRGIETEVVPNHWHTPKKRHFPPFYHQCHPQIHQEVMMTPPSWQGEWNFSREASKQKLSQIPCTLQENVILHHFSVPRIFRSEGLKDSSYACVCVCHIRFKELINQLVN